MRSNKAQRGLGAGDPDKPEYASKEELDELEESVSSGYEGRQGSDEGLHPKRTQASRAAAGRKSGRDLVKSLASAKKLVDSQNRSRYND